MRPVTRWLSLPSSPYPWACLGTCAALLAACGPSAPPPAVPGDDPASARPAPQPLELTPAEGAVAIDSPCTEGVDERCDGVDQNCDGRIDEGCGYEQGALQVTLAWNSDADLDLVVAPPDGPSLDSSNDEVHSGGRLDREARGACAEETSRDRLENAYWATDPPSGDYAISVSYISGCVDDPPATTATVSISYGGQIRGVHNVTLTGPGSVPVATLTVP